MVQQIDNLQINYIISFVKSIFPNESYFIESKAGCIVPSRAFVCNLGNDFVDKISLVNSFAPHEFDKFIQEALAKREKKYVSKKGI